VIRAGVFIGVDQTRAKLPTLQDAAASANAMRDWAVKHGGMKSGHAVSVTDAPRKNGKRRPVTKKAVFDAVDKLTADADVILLYFSGHGVTTEYQQDEHWLLSGAPHDPNEAISVTQTQACARLGSVPYVCIISDACRVPAGPELAVDGGTAFPNDPTPGQAARVVDLFYSCRFGQTSKEVGKKSISAQARSWYTVELLAVLAGELPGLFEPRDDFRYLWPKNLEAYFTSGAFRERKQAFLKKLGLGAGDLNENPESFVLSKGADYEWLARQIRPQPAVPVPPKMPHGTWEDWGRGEIMYGGEAGQAGGEAVAEAPRWEGIDGFELRYGALVPAGPIDGLWDLSRVSQRLMEAAIDSEPTALELALEAAVRAPANRAAELVATIRRLIEGNDPTVFDTGWGIVVRGATVAEAEGPKTGQVRTLDLNRVQCHYEKNACVTVTFTHGAVIAVPVFPGFIAHLTFADGALIDIGYEPAPGSSLWEDFTTQRGTLRALRAVVAATVAHTRYRLDGIDTGPLVDHMCYGQWIDPTLALYTSYPLYDLQDMDGLADIAERLKTTIGGQFYDVELVQGRLDPRLHPGEPPATVGFAPLLSCGWSLLSAFQVRDLNMLRGLRPAVSSPWTLFDAEARTTLINLATQGVHQ